jgi:D-methionine transport system ATP-binding protein
MSVELFRLEQVNVQGEVGNASILRNLSLHVNQGDRLAIVGASGSGKSTLLRLFNRLRDASSGKIWYEQQAIAKLPITALRQQVTFVPQEPKLLGMTVREAIAYPLTLRNTSKKNIAERVDAILTEFRIPGDWLAQTELQLSLAQRQWVALARALVSSPKVLLLDEPTIALDGSRAQQLEKILASRSLTSSLTLVVVNRQLEWLQRVCDRVIYLEQGEIVWEAISADVNWHELADRIRAAETQDVEDWAL